MIEAKGLVKRYGELTAVDGVDLHVARGMSFGLLGPNGAGKTTTISMLCGLLRPDAGRVSIGGEADPTRPQVRRMLGSAPQSLALYLELSAAENLRFFGRLHGLRGPALSARVDHALEVAGLTSRRADRVAGYSGGMKRRLNLACALVHEPPVLFLDEPTVGVDPQSRQLIHDTICALKAEGLTLLYTTHYLEEAEQLCDRVAIIDHGKLLAEGTVDELVRDHGGRSGIAVEFESPPPEDVELPGQLDGRRLTMDAEAPLTVVGQLAALGLPIRELHVERPDLGQVFLQLTGRALRDD